MNFLKNLVILAVLAAAGYGIYISLTRNSVDTGQPPGVADDFMAGPKVEMPSAAASPSPTGPLALGPTTVRPAGGIGAGFGAAAPPFMPPTPANPVRDPLGAAPLLTFASPYPSSAPSSVGSSAATGMFASPPSTGPTATLGLPTSPDAISAAGSLTAVSQGPSSPAAAPRDQMPGETVRNLTPPPEVAGPSGALPSSAPAVDGLLQAKFAAFMNAVQKSLDEGRLADAHLALSKMYGNPDLPPEQAKQITDLLDRLAGTVIYSRQHYLERPYVTQPGDTLAIVSRKYDVPWQLLARINGLMPPGAQGDDSPTKGQPLPVGMELKVVRGPFDAIVKLDKHELTLVLQNRYAGRFRIGVGRDQPKLDGDYTVRDKATNPAYYGPDGVNISPNDPKNPLGGAWIGLTDRIGIHGTNDPQALGRDDNRGTICVSDRDLQDLYGILSVGSRVTILR